MLTVEIDNSVSRVLGMGVSAFSMLRKTLSYETDANSRYFAGGNFPTRKYLIDKKGYFPTGLLERVFTVLGDSDVDVVDKRKRPALGSASKLYGPDLYRWQREAVVKAVRAEQAGIVAVTGSGKSRVIAALCAAMGKRKTLIVVPTLELKKQLTETLADALKSNAKYVRVENIDSTALKTLKDFDALILDEVHHAAAKTYRNLNKMAWNGIYYRFFLTATYFRNQESEQMLFESIAGRPVFELNYQTAVKNGYIVPVEAYYLKMPKIKTDAFTYREVYNELVVNNETRNQAIADVLAGVDGPALCLVREIAHGNTLSALTGVPFANGQDEESRQFINDFNAGKITSLIATTGVCGEGVDTKPCEYVVIAGLGKAKSAFMQQVGRGVRQFGTKKSAKIILIKDPSHKYLLRHFNEQVNILKDEYGVIAEEI